MALYYPDRLESNNPAAYGIVKAILIAGHRTVTSLTDLYALSDAILSDSGTNENNDAIGQRWYVIDEDRYYQLITWNNRTSAEGWSKVDDSSDIIDTVSEYTINGYKISSNPVLTKNDIGLDNVDNTSDINKPVSTAQQSAIDTAKSTIDNYTVNGYTISSNPTLDNSDIGLENVTNDAQVKRSEMGVANGVATLGSDGYIPSDLLNLKTINGESVYGSGDITIDMDLYVVATSLPTSNIDTNKIYVVPGEETESNNIYVEWIYVNDAWEKVGEFKPDVDLSNYVTFDDVASTSKSGVMSSTDKSRLDDIYSGLYTGNLELVTPTITGTWTFYNNSGTEVQSSNIANTPSTSGNPVLEYGYGASFSGTYSWTSESNKKDPTSLGSDSSWSTLTTSGLTSDTYTTGIVKTNTTVKVILEAAKTGFMLNNDGSTIISASGNDQTLASMSVSFSYRKYYGAMTGNTINETNIKALTSTLSTSKSLTASSVTCNTSLYYVYAYPQSLGTLTTIIQDGAQPVLGAFTQSTLTITNDAGASVDLYVYISNNPGAFTNALLEFS